MVPYLIQMKSQKHIFKKPKFPLTSLIESLLLSTHVAAATLPILLSLEHISNIPKSEPLNFFFPLLDMLTPSPLSGLY